MRISLWMTAMTLGAMTAMTQAQGDNPFPLTLDAEAEAWVQETLESLTLEEMVGQMLCSHTPWTAAENLASFEEQAAIVEDLQMGGIIVGGGSCETMTPFINEIQSRLKVPALVCADFEMGVGRLWSDATRVPTLMALAATGDPENARIAGAITGAEARIGGVNWILSPVCDVNINPENPIINIRSFGEDPSVVAEFATAYIEGAQSSGAMACAKHFPGHGDTAQDSHIELAVVDADRTRLEAVEFPPFQAAVDAGVSSVMTSHIYFPELMQDEGRIPVTVSPNVMTGLLRDEMGFGGLTVTDSMRMHGITEHYSAGEAAVLAVKAGVDMNLVSADYREAYAAILDAVADGEISDQTIRDSVERILRCKAWLGLHHERMVDVDAAIASLSQPEAVAQAREIYEKTITVVRDDNHILPITPDREKTVAHIVIFDQSTRWWPNVIDPLTETLVDHFGQVTREMVFENPTPVVLERFYGESFPTTGMTSARRSRLMDLARDSDIVVVSALVRIAAFQGSISLSEEGLAFLNEVTALDKPVVFTAMGSPYLVTAVPDAPNMILTYDYAPTVATAVGSAILGQSDVTGRLPVTLPGLAERGDGLQIVKMGESE